MTHGVGNIKIVCLVYTWVVNAKPGRFTPLKETRYSLFKELGGPQGRCAKSQLHWDSISGPSIS